MNLSKTWCMLQSATRKISADSVVGPQQGIRLTTVCASLGRLLRHFLFAWSRRAEFAKSQCPFCRGRARYEDCWTCPPVGTPCGARRYSTAGRRCAGSRGPARTRRDPRAPTTRKVRTDAAPENHSDGATPRFVRLTPYCVSQSGGRGGKPDKAGAVSLCYLMRFQESQAARVQVRRTPANFLVEVYRTACCSIAHRLRASTAERQLSPRAESAPIMTCCKSEERARLSSFRGERAIVPKVAAIR
ncbi:hypothetical protein GGD65_005395 [Bradyrhizobium sp. CIR18]|nr:hypothetical protein [Bradyrhizobium sp. CIR18]